MFKILHKKKILHKMVKTTVGNEYWRIASEIWRLQNLYNIKNGEKNNKKKNKTFLQKHV